MFDPMIFDNMLEIKEVLLSSAICKYRDDIIRLKHYIADIIVGFRARESLFHYCLVTTISQNTFS